MTLTQFSIRAMQVLGAIAVQRYCSRHRISDRALDFFVEHLWRLASASSLPEWEKDGATLEITGLGDPLPKRIRDRISVQQAGELQQVCEAALEIGMSQLYSDPDPDGAERFLQSAARLAGFDLDAASIPPLFLEHAPGKSGWGTPVSKELLKKWREFARTEISR